MSIDEFYEKLKGYYPEVGDYIALDHFGQSAFEFNASWHSSRVVSIIGDNYYMSYDNQSHPTCITKFAAPILSYNGNKVYPAILDRSTKR